MENINTEVALFLPPTWGQVLGYTTLKWPHLTFVNDDKKEEKTRAFQLSCLHLSSDRVISAVLLTNRNGMNVTAETLFHKDFEGRVSPQPKRFFPNQKKFCLILYKASNVFLIDIQHDIYSQDKEKWHVTFLSTEIIWIMELPFKIKILNIQDWTA